MGGGVTFYAHSPFPSLYHDSMWVNCDVIPKTYINPTTTC